jgi:cysteine-rich repeat protein
MENDEAVCGNGILETGETCDDGNNVNGDGCSNTCQTEITGCDLTSAGWSTTNVVEGTNVNLNVYGTNCNGKTISFVVKEDDLVGSNDVNINPVNVVFSGTTATGTWTAEYQTDISGDPEYYFIATVVGETENIESGKSDTELLHVSESVTEDLVLHRPETLSFSGLNYEEIAHENAFLIDDGTVAFWFDANNVNAVQGLLSKDSTGYDTGGHLSISIESGRIEARLQSTTGDNYVQTTTTLNPNNPYHIALIFGSDGMKLYLNGDLEDSNSYTGGLGTTSGGSGNFEPIVIGAASWNSDDLSATPVTYHFTGDIKDIRLYNKILTEAEIASLALVENGCGDGTCDPGEDCNTCSSDCGVCPPNGDPDGDHPNEPSGFTVIFDQPWNELPNGDAAGWGYSGSSSNFALGSDSNAPESRPSVLVGTYPTTHNTTSGYTPFDLEKVINDWNHNGLAGEATEVYFTWRQKLSANWQSHRSGNKVMLFWGQIGPSDTDGGPAYYTGQSTVPPVPLGSSFQDHVDARMVFQVHTQGIHGNASHGHGPNVGSYWNAEVFRDVWQQLEVHLSQGSAPGSNDGFIRFWVDGVLVGDYPNQLMVGEDQDMGFGSLYEFSPYYGGGESDPITEDMTISVDHIYASGNQ